MTSDPTDSDFGGYLRRAREAAGLSLEDVERRTRVRAAWIERLETSRLEELPAEVYVRGFVRAIAKAVGADEQVASRMLAERLAERNGREQDVETSRFAEALRQLESGGRRRVGVALAVIVLLIAATLMVSMLLRRPAPAAGPISNAPVAALGAASSV